MEDSVTNSFDVVSMVEEIVGVVSVVEETVDVVSVVDEIVRRVESSEIKKPNKKKLQGGNICCIHGCHTTSRRNKGIGLFKPTNIKNEYHMKWRSKVDQIILRHRTPDKKYKELVEKRKIFVYEIALQRRTYRKNKNSVRYHP